MKEADVGRQKGIKESFYDTLPFTKRQMDIIIVMLFAALVIFFVIGALKGNGYIK
jgi:hypothetical protein